MRHFWHFEGWEEKVASFSDVLKYGAQWATTSRCTKIEHEQKKKNLQHR
jgi:hypothetical protein